MRKMLRALARTEGLDDIAAALGALMVTSAELADLVSSDDPTTDTPIYARAKVLSCHAGMLAQLHTMVGPVVEESNLHRWMADIARPRSEEEGRASKEWAEEYWRAHRVGFRYGKRL
jgi:hypothetical protein